MYIGYITSPGLFKSGELNHDGHKYSFQGYRPPRPPCRTTKRLSSNLPVSCSYFLTWHLTSLSITTFQLKRKQLRGLFLSGFFPVWKWILIWPSAVCPLLSVTLDWIKYVPFPKKKTFSVWLVNTFQFPHFLLVEKKFRKIFFSETVSLVSFVFLNGRVSAPYVITGFNSEIFVHLYIQVYYAYHVYSFLTRQRPACRSESVETFIT